MTGETNLNKLLKTMKPKHIFGDYVFCTITRLSGINLDDVILFFKEEEGHTVVVSKPVADKLGLNYSFVAAWITLTVHSSLEAVGLTAAFSKALSENNISCNVVAAFYHDHIFVNQKDVKRAMEILNKISE